MDSHLEMDFEDRMSGSFTDDPHGFEDDPISDDYEPSMYESENHCEGHPADEHHPMGETWFCDGTCRV